MKRFARLLFISAITVLLSCCASDVPIYRGAVLNGVPHGHGWKLWPTGEKYDGEWYSGQISGRGVYSWPNGNRAEGQFSQGVLDGQGTMTYADGGNYTGEWRNGVRSGRGEMKYANKNRYNGSWENGEPSGDGTFELNNGNLYIGRFSSGNRNGSGAAVAFLYKQSGKWCIDNCAETSSQFAIVVGEFPADPDNHSVTLKPCDSDQINCRTLVAPALLAYQNELARKLAEAERERVRLAAETERERERLAAEAERERKRLADKAEREKAIKEAAILAEKKRIADERYRFLHETGTVAQVYMDADRLESDKDYVQASEVYRIVVTRFPESPFAAGAMTRLGAMRDKRDQQEAEQKRQAAEEKRQVEEGKKRAEEAEVRAKEAELREDAIKKREAAAEARIKAAEQQAQQAQQPAGSALGEKLQDELIKQGTKKLLDRLF